jgi:RimJ/RimL family protein N-acetyltransferase
VIILETARLLLRRYTLADVDALSEVICDHDNMRFFPKRFEREDAVDWIEKNLQRYAEDGVGGWALILKSGDGREIFGGYCGLAYRDVDGARELEVGYALARRCQGQGLATEGARACMDYAFTQLKIDRVISLIRPENLPSRRVAERNGMAVEKETEWAGEPHLVYVGRRPGSSR